MNKALYLDVESYLRVLYFGQKYDDFYEIVFWVKKTLYCLASIDSLLPETKI